MKNMSSMGRLPSRQGYSRSNSARSTRSYESGRDSKRGGGGGGGEDIESGRERARVRTLPQGGDVSPMGMGSRANTGKTSLTRRDLLSTPEGLVKELTKAGWCGIGGVIVFFTITYTAIIFQVGISIVQIYLNSFHQFQSIHGCDNSWALVNVTDSNINQAYVCTELTDSEPSTRNNYYRCLGLAFFTIYFMNETTQLYKFFAFKRIFSSAHTLGKSIFWAYFLSNLSQTFLVVYIAWIFIFFSTDIVDMLINSTAALFLVEMDDLLIAVALNWWFMMTNGDEDGEVELFGFDVTVPPGFFQPSELLPLGPPDPSGPPDPLGPSEVEDSLSSMKLQLPTSGAAINISDINDTNTTNGINLSYKYEQWAEVLYEKTSTQDQQQDMTQIIIQRNK